MQNLTIEQIMENLVIDIQSVRFSGYGHYKITYKANGEEHYYVTTDLELIDLYKEDRSEAEPIILEKLRDDFQGTIWQYC